MTIILTPTYCKDRPVWQIQIVSLAFAVPLSLGAAHGMEFNLAHCLLPVSVLAILSSLGDRLTLLFVGAGICGLIAVAVAHYFYPGNMVGNVAELVVWTMAAPAFLFVGRALPLNPLIFWVAIFSAIFLVLVTIPILLTGEPVRAMYLFHTPGRRPGTEFLNIRFFGFPVFATYGINSIAPLLCIQATTLCYGIATSKSWLRLLFAVGLFCAVFLVMGSNSRAAQGSMALISVAVFVYCYRRREIATALVVASVAAGALFLTMTRDVTARDVGSVKDTAPPRMVNSRMVESARAIARSFSLMAPDDNQPVQVDTRIAMGEITTGRIDLWRAVASDILRSPIVGNGFSGFGRFGPASPELAVNTTAHNYYLNLLWKGGILFFVPFSAFMFFALRRAWFARNDSASYYFATTAVLVTALLPSLTWDTLNILSAGALAWLLLGSLGGSQIRSDE